MTQWNKIHGNSNLIQADTGSAVLIKLPKQDTKFWMPKKLVRLSGKNDYLMTVSYPHNWEFKDTTGLRISVAEIVAAFGGITEPN